MERKYLDEKIRKVPNFPKAGILFYDISTLFEDHDTFSKIMDEICARYQDKKIDKVVGIDARGFLMASVMAYKLGAGISIVRKEGKLPYKTIKSSYEKEYGKDTIEIHEDTIKPGEKVIIADDLLATGGTMLATLDLVEQLKGEIVGIEVIINLSFLPGYKKILERGYDTAYLIDYDNEDIK
jgi:adenine phosphoribosyltransferase